MYVSVYVFMDVTFLCFLLYIVIISLYLYSFIDVLTGDELTDGKSAFSAFLSFWSRNRMYVLLIA